MKAPPRVVWLCSHCKNPSKKEELPSAIWSKALSKRGQLKSVYAHFFIFSLYFFSHTSGKIITREVVCLHVPSFFLIVIQFLRIFSGNHFRKLVCTSALVLHMILKWMAVLHRILKWMVNRVGNVICLTSEKPR